MFKTDLEMTKLGSEGDVLSDTLHTWQCTRIKGGSASMCTYGDVSIPLLKAFDEVARLERTRGTRNLDY